MSKGFRDLTIKKISDANVILTGIPYDNAASCGKGASEAPQVIRELSEFLPPLSMNGENLNEIKLFDNGNIGSNLYKQEDLFKELEQVSSQLFQTGKFNVFIGGDHSVSIPIEKQFVLYAQKNNKIPVVIHIDAHPDICYKYCDNLNSHACTNRRTLEVGLNTKDLFLLGVRGFESQEIDFFKEHKDINIYYASDFKLESNNILQEILNKIDDNNLVYISYDIDANDPSFAPGTGTPEAFGLDSYKIMQMITSLVKNKNVIAMDIVEVAPSLDCNNITSWLALKTLYEVFNTLANKNRK